MTLAEAAGQREPRAALTRLAAPLAPPVAADRMGVELDWRHWVREIRRLSAGAEVALVEGAGGLLSPLAWDFTALDLARELKAVAIVVAADRLGTINHARLTLAALRAARVPVLGLVLSAPACPDDSTGGNAAALARVEPGLWIASIPRLADPLVAAAHLSPVAAWLAP